MMKGGFDTIPNFTRRLKSVVKRELINGEDTPANRKTLVQTLITVFNSLLHMPDNCKELVHEEFDPTIVI